MATRGPEPFFLRIEALREQKRMSVKALCVAAEISLETYRKWKLGLTRRPDTETFERVAKALGVDLPAIIVGPEAAPPRDANDEVIEDYIVSPMGADLTAEQRTQLRRSKEWIPHQQRPLLPREVHSLADLIRSWSSGAVPIPLNRQKNRPLR